MQVDVTFLSGNSTHFTDISALTVELLQFVSLKVNSPAIYSDSNFPASESLRYNGFSKSFQNIIESGEC